MPHRTALFSGTLFALAAGLMWGLVFVAPLMLAVALAIACSSPGPVIFRQSRLGKGGVDVGRAVCTEASLHLTRVGVDALVSHEFHLPQIAEFQRAGVAERGLCVGDPAPSAQPVPTRAT